MANDFFLNNDRESQVQMELLAALLEPEDAPYPWNPADPESEAYFVAREQELALLEGWSEAEIAVPRQTFLTALDSLWAATTLSSEANKEDAIAIQTNLQQRFAARVPQGWLEAIAHQAHQVFSSPASIAQQLVECIQELVPNWAEEDLLVLARPFAYEMRGKEIEAVDFVLGKVEHQDWAALTEIEQARVGLAIARYALDQLQSKNNKGAT